LFNLLSRTRKKSTELEVDRQSPYGTNFYILYLNLSSAADDLKASPGTVEAVLHLPSAADKVLYIVSAPLN